MTADVVDLTLPLHTETSGRKETRPNILGIFCGNDQLCSELLVVVGLLMGLLTLRKGCACVCCAGRVLPMTCVFLPVGRED